MVESAGLIETILIEIQRHSARFLPTYLPFAIHVATSRPTLAHPRCFTLRLCRFPVSSSPPPLLKRQCQCQVMMEVKIVNCAANGGWYVVVPLSKIQKFRKERRRRPRRRRIRRNEIITQFE